ncbi:MAG: alpha/beta hydrolase [Pseudomonadota bacterium]
MNRVLKSARLSVWTGLLGIGLVAGCAQVAVDPDAPLPPVAEPPAVAMAEAPAAAPAEFGEMGPEARFRMMAAGPRKTHCGGPSNAPTLTANLRYEAAAPPPCSSNVHGETETLNGGVEATHWFIEADGVTWHVVTAGDPENEAVLFLHGLPETWYGFNRQMAALSDEYYTISIDQMGYGQSDKRLDLDFSNPAMADKLGALIDTMGLDTLNIVGHDRGAITLDYMLAVDGMSDRVVKYVRMQQSGNRPHGEPRPPHKVFASQAGVEVFARDIQIRMLYTTKSGYSSVDVDPAEIDRMAFEFLHEGAAEAISENFKTTNFDKELDDRMKDGGLFESFTMPVLFLQGVLDPGQHREEYLNLNEDVPTASVIFVEDASHFLHVEKPETVTAIIREFLASDDTTNVGAATDG